MIADIEASLGVSMTIGSLLTAPDFQPWLRRCTTDHRPLLLGSLQGPS